MEHGAGDLTGTAAYAQAGVSRNDLDRNRPDLINAVAYTDDLIGADRDAIPATFTFFRFYYYIS